MSSLPLPNPKWVCKAFYPYYLTPDVPLCRVFNMEQGKKLGFGPLDWNDRVPPALPDEGGRFDATRYDRFKYLYGAEAFKSVEIAILETLLPLCVRDTKRQRRVIQRAAVNARALQKFHISDEVTMADLRLPEGLEPFGAPPNLASDMDRVATRAWGKYIRASNPRDIQGLVYNSSKRGRKQKQASFILYEDRVPGLQFFAASKLYPLSERPGRNWANDFLAARNILIV